MYFCQHFHSLHNRTISVSLCAIGIRNKFGCTLVNIFTLLTLGLEVIKLEFILRLKIERIDWLLADTSLYFWELKQVRSSQTLKCFRKPKWRNLDFRCLFLLNFQIEIIVELPCRIRVYLKANGISHSYQLDMSVFILRVVGWYLSLTFC